MVYIKVTDGAETRKFRVTPGEITFDQLKEKIASLFPRAMKEETSDLTLKYRDAEGDIITISSDNEFQEVLSELPVDHTWKMHISSPRGEREQRGGSRPHTQCHFNQPSFGMRHHHLFDRETRELMDLLFGVHAASTSEKKGDPKPSTSEDKGEHTPSTSEDKAEPTAEDNKPSTSEDSGDLTPSTSEDNGDHTPSTPEDKVEAEENKENGEVKSKSSSEPPSNCPAHPHYHIKAFRSWEPLVVGGLFGPTRRIFGPVGYQMTSGGCRSILDHLATACA